MDNPANHHIYDRHSTFDRSAEAYAGLDWIHLTTTMFKEEVLQGKHTWNRHCPLTQA
jgi:hypothetical protein